MEINAHINHNANLSLCLPRQLAFGDYHHALVTDHPAESCAISTKTKEQNRVFLLYRYPLHNAEQADVFASQHRTINFNPKLYKAICAAAEIDPNDHAGPEDDFRVSTGDARASEVKVFDYIYAVLYSPKYRETYAAFLKIDFPCIPYPASPDVFFQVSSLGEKLRRLHLMEAAEIGDTPYPFEGDGDDVVAAGYPKFEDGKVLINQDQYFANIPSIAWKFLVGGYLPAQKWLKDRRGNILSWDDIGHYQKIVKILVETDQIMNKIKLPLDPQ